MNLILSIYYSDAHFLHAFNQDVKTVFIPYVQGVNVQSFDVDDKFELVAELGKKKATIDLRNYETLVDLLNEKNEKYWSYLAKISLEVLHQLSIKPFDIKKVEMSVFQYSALEKSNRLKSVLMHHGIKESEEVSDSGILLHIVEENFGEEEEKELIRNISTISESVTQILWAPIAVISRDNFELGKLKRSKILSNVLWYELDEEPFKVELLKLAFSSKNEENPKEIADDDSVYFMSDGEQNFFDLEKVLSNAGWVLKTLAGLTGVERMKKHRSLLSSTVKFALAVSNNDRWNESRIDDLIKLPGYIKLQKKPVLYVIGKLPSHLSEKLKLIQADIHSELGSNLKF